MYKAIKKAGVYLSVITILGLGVLSGSREASAEDGIPGIIKGPVSALYHVGNSIVEGNKKMPIIGTLEVFKGIRRGAIRGTEEILGSPFSDSGYDIADKGLVNTAIEKNKTLEFMLDTGIAAGAGAWIGNQSAEPGEGALIGGLLNLGYETIKSLSGE